MIDKRVEGDGGASGKDKGEKEIAQGMKKDGGKEDQGGDEPAGEIGAVGAGCFRDGDAFGCQSGVHWAGLTAGGGV
jgi:hypothetical protein